jgi:tetratricopeptide (TPR) repeat protein
MRAYSSLFILIISSLPGIALAGDKEQEKAAKKACATTDYKKGIDLLADLYVDSNNPTYVYNQGRCYEQNSQYGQAIERFREYLRKAPNLTPEAKTDVERHIEDCERLHAKSTTPAPVVFPVPTTTAPSPPAPPGEKPDVFTKSMGQSENGVGQRLAGFITTTAGVAILASGFAFNLLHESMVNQQNTGQFSRSREEKLGTYETLAWVGYGVGTAAIVTGGALWFWGRTASGNDAKGIALHPIYAPGAAGVRLQGMF